MDDKRIIAQLEFEEAYREYTRASNRVFNAMTEEVRQKERMNFEKASKRFNLAYKNLKEYESII